MDDDDEELVLATDRITDAVELPNLPPRRLFRLDERELSMIPGMVVVCFRSGQEIEVRSTRCCEKDCNFCIAFESTWPVVSRLSSSLTG